MPGPTAQPLLVTAAQEEILRSLARQHKAPQRLVRRLRIILAASEGLGVTDTAQRLRLAPSTVQLWRARWFSESERLVAAEDDPQLLSHIIEEVFSDAPRSGTPPTFSAEQVAQILALACEDPRGYGREVTHWTPRELAHEIVKQGIAESISPRSVGRFLKRGRPQTPPEPVLAPSRG
jgi:putative transposase